MPQKLYLHEPISIRGLMSHSGFAMLLRRLPDQVVWALFVFVTALISVLILGAIALFLDAPFVFPSVGATAILFFFHPLSPSASPRHAVYGHSIGILCGYASLWLLGLEHSKFTLGQPIDVRRVIAAALSLAFSTALMILLRAAHAPAGATALIVSLGLMTSPIHLLAIEMAVVLLATEAVIINRAVGLPYPFWASPKGSSMERAESSPYSRRPSPR